MIRKRLLQKAEKEFINSVTKSVLECDLSKTHYLLDYNGVIKYLAVSYNQKFEDQINSEANALCVFSEDMIRDFHYKAGGTDDLAKQWVKNAVKAVIAHGKEVSKRVYSIKF